MNTKTTTATRTAKNAEGQRFQLPQSWPTSQDFETMRNGMSVFADLIRFCDNTLTAGNSIRFSDRCQLWEQIEETFLAVHGSTWQEMIAELRQMQEDAPVAAPVYPQCLAPIGPEEVAELERIHESAGRFRPVSKDTYCQLFKGAASSRRAGLTWQIWGRRATGLGYPRGLVALIAFRAYSMPTADVLKVSA